MDDITALVSTIAGDIVSRFQKVRKHEVHSTISYNYVINVTSFLLGHQISDYKPMQGEKNKYCESVYLIL